MILPSFTFESALSYIESKLRDFYAVSDELLTELQNARDYLQQAYRSGLMIPEATAHMSDVILAINEHADLERRLQPFAEALGLSGLGQLSPIQWAIALVGGTAGVIAVGVSLYAFFDHYQRLKATKELIREGILPPEALTGKPTVFESIGDIFSKGSLFIVFAVAGYFLFSQSRGSK